jgi:hypothetical protein
MRRRLLIPALLAAAIVGTGHSYAARQVSYGPAVVLLAGRTTVESHFGPPNFGESPKTDTKEDVPILVLDAPVDVISDARQQTNRGSHTGVKRVQLVGTLLPKLLQTEGRHVVLSGMLFEKQSGENFTDVIFDVVKIDRVD